jgi:small subunit ribosomal protein S4e
MAKKHLKTLTVPVTWPIKRKGQIFVVRPRPNKSAASGMPISLVFKDLLKYAKTAKEVKTILSDKEVHIDGKRRKDMRYVVGLMDVLSMPVLNEHHRMLLNKNGKLELVKITQEESGLKLAKIIGKKVLKGKRLQLNLSDGRNLLVKDDKYAVGDSLLLKLPGEIVEAFKIEKDSYAFLTKGSHTGYHGVIEDIKNNIVTIKTKDGKFETPKESVFVVGKNKPSIKLD